MKHPLVSVIIPLYNGENFLRDCLESVVAQDYHPVEILVIDDGSTDGSADIARSFEEIHYHYQQNGGVADARNNALKMAHGDLIAFLDQDDTWTPDKLRKQVDYLLAHPEDGYVIGRQKVFLPEGMERPIWVHEDAVTTGQLTPIPGTILVRRELFDIVGRYDTSYRNGSDTDWIYRAQDAGIQYGTIDDIVLYKKVHASNESHATKVNRAETFRALRDSVLRKRQGVSRGA